MEDKMFDHLRSSTDAKYIKSLKELFMDFYGTITFTMEGSAAHLFVFLCFDLTAAF